MIGDHQNCMFKSDNGLLLASPSRQPAVLSRQVGVLGMRGSMGSLVQSRGQSLVSFGRLARTPLACTLVITRRYASPRRQMIFSGEAAHIRADFRNNDLSHFPSNSGNGVQPDDRFFKRVAIFLHLLVETLNGFVQTVDLAKQFRQDKKMMRFDPSFQSFGTT